MDLKTLDPAQSARSLLDEFKAFAFKGNVINLAVGVIIGGAFGKIVTSLVSNIIMPLVGMILPSNQSYKDWQFTRHDQHILYGHFLADIVDFLILAVALFVFIVKFLGWIMKSRNQEDVPPPPSRQEQLLEEIRDLLKQRTPESP